jgi:vanillate/4-hydroxybenzoate decarboxylase subunit C
MASSPLPAKESSGTQPKEGHIKAFKDLPEFLQLLERENQLIRVTEAVDLEPDLGAAGRAVSQFDETAPALLFDSVKGYASAHVALNVHGSWANQALMLGMDKTSTAREIFLEFVKRYEKFPGEMVRSTKAPWQEVMIEKDINLLEHLPLFRINRGDGGFFIEKGCIISRDPADWNNDNVENVGIYRMQLKGKNRLGIQVVPEHDIAIQLCHAEECGQDLPLAIAIGNEPIITIVGGMPILYDQLEYKMAAALQGQPYQVVATEKGLDVPWGSQYVLEGRVLAGKREGEGPLGEFTGSYSGGRNYPVVEIDRISHVRDPIFEACYLGMPWTELDYLLAINTSAPLYAQVKSEIPEVVAVNAIYNHGFVVIVSTRRRFGGFAKAVGMRILSTPHGLGYAKTVIVVNENVDPYDLKQVMWALATKVNPIGDVFIIPNLSVNPLDQSAQPEEISSKMIIDATTPVPPDRRGNFSIECDSPQRTELWREKLKTMRKEPSK